MLSFQVSPSGAEIGGLRLAHRLREIRSHQQRRDFGCQCERRIAAVLFPAVLLGDGAVGHNE